MYISLLFAISIESNASNRQVKWRIGLRWTGSVTNQNQPNWRRERAKKTTEETNNVPYRNISVSIWFDTVKLHCFAKVQCRLFFSSHFFIEISNRVENESEWATESVCMRARVLRIVLCVYYFVYGCSECVYLSVHIYIYLCKFVCVIKEALYFVHSATILLRWHENFRHHQKQHLLITFLFCVFLVVVVFCSGNEPMWQLNKSIKSLNAHISFFNHSYRIQFSPIHLNLLLCLQSPQFYCAFAIAFYHSFTISLSLSHSNRGIAIFKCASVFVFFRTYCCRC